ncbi:uncharacterized protein PADG_12091 [Paracoccidioides brasiliensis Pb18]|uniref:Uncharacterized protein n=1 Tax=Paracoccidioides brasiliensis (strain Pb18) TaxID=502780 RepID=A0A0A0HUV3_PARBD|nr:uncharacterized protein PADG_12091 [Paracoccidioides brasiliensis Pb18]KGM91781.1 hypothetical protein PADG_12091 [Paracoccidioides brasiliensis Pb18]
MEDHRPGHAGEQRIPGRPFPRESDMNVSQRPTVDRPQPEPEPRGTPGFRTPATHAPSRRWRRVGADAPRTLKLTGGRRGHRRCRWRPRPHRRSSSGHGKGSRVATRRRGWRSRGAGMPVASRPAVTAEEASRVPTDTGRPNRRDAAHVAGMRHRHVPTGDAVSSRLQLPPEPFLHGSCQTALAVPKICVGGTDLYVSDRNWAPLPPGPQRSFPSTELRSNGL